MVRAATLAPLLLSAAAPPACRAFLAPPSPVARPSAAAVRPVGRAARRSIAPPRPPLASRPAGCRPATQRHSLRPLIEEIASSSTSGGETPVIFVGGKGGVGKTSISSALAVELASSFERDWNVLIVSTDPAHSLGDALDVDLRTADSGREGADARPKPTTLAEPLTNLRLHALEVDPRAALAEFQEKLRLFDPSTLSSSLGVDVSPDALRDLGLDELQSLIRNPPPGLDELVALANVLDPEFAETYDVIVVDTAPTGHTLRMLQLPQFLDGFLTTLLKLRQKLKGLVSTLQMFMGGAEGDFARAASNLDVDDALEALEGFRERAAGLRRRLANPDATRFVVVSIPTILSARESERLMGELGGQGIRVSDLVVNQCVGGALRADEGGEEGVPEAMRSYYDRRVAGQQRWIAELRDACADVSSSEEYRGNVADGPGGDADISVTEVPFYDMELVGAPALGYLGAQTFGAAPSFERLVGFDDRGSGSPRVVICGGKGGVGKTTTSSSLAVAMASAGHDVAIVSTDPAHSLGDALDMDLRGGSLVDVPLYGVPPIPGADEGSLKAMEIDPTSALKEFRESIDNLLGRRNDGNGDSELSSTLNALGEIIDTLPAGTDEVVALAKVIRLVRRGGFDRVVLDTAPTGHTLRMLSAPSFLADLIEKALLVARKVNSNAAVRMLLSSAAAAQGASREEMDDAAAAAKDALLKFQVSMYDLEDLFADPSSTEFLIVTAPTELAVRESVRLLNDLTFGDPDMPLRVRNAVVNQVLEGGDGDDADERLRGFGTRLARSQASSIEEMERTAGRMGSPPRMTKVAMLDTEPRGVYGLKALSGQLLAEPAEAEVGS